MMQFGPTECEVRGKFLNGFAQVVLVFNLKIQVTLITFYSLDILGNCANTIWHTGVFAK